MHFGLSTQLKIYIFPKLKTKSGNELKCNMFLIFKYLLLLILKYFICNTSIVNSQSQLFFSGNFTSIITKKNCIYIFVCYHFIKFYDITLSWTTDSANWLIRNSTGEPYLCGNVTGSRHCPSTHTCLCTGDNPNHGYTSFDNFLWSMLTTFQLITLDYWENVYNMVRTIRLSNSIRMSNFDNFLLSLILVSKNILSR